jgi:RND family efflux transporter MFP subunit
LNKQRQRAGAVAIAAMWVFAARAETLNEFAERASCLIAPNNVYKLAMPAQGAIAEVAVNRADKIEKGQIVAELESGVEKSQVEAARARASTDAFVRLKTAIYDAAEAKVARERTLRASNVASQQTLEEAESAAAVAKADVEQAELDKTMAGFDLQRLEATLQRRILRSPAKGVVTSVDLHAGEFADPSTPIITLTEIDPLKVDVYLPTSAYSLIEPGRAVTISPLDAVNGARSGEVITKDPQIDASSGLFLVEIRLPNPDGAIPAGIRCRVEFP